MNDSLCADECLFSEYNMNLTQIFKPKLSLNRDDNCSCHDSPDECLVGLPFACVWLTNNKNKNIMIIIIIIQYNDKKRITMIINNTMTKE